jgi:uncharacterized protein (TIGR00645 family)
MKNSLPSHKPTPSGVAKLLEKSEHFFESGIFFSRWIQAPIYGALIIAAILYAFKSVLHLIELLTHVMTITESEIMLGILSLVDISMVANLVNMVVIGGYVTFVSKIDFGDHKDRPDWLAKINANTLKIKLSGSLASISAIHLLRAFIDIKNTEPTILMWQCIIHGVFLISLIMFVVSDYIQNKSHSAH